MESPVHFHTAQNDVTASVDLTSDILSRHLDQHFRVYPMSDTPASYEDIVALSKLLGVVFPAEYCGHLCGRFPGIYIEVKEDVWPRGELYSVGPLWTFQYAFHTYTPCPDGNDWMRLDYVGSQFQQSTGHKAVPILRIAEDADVYCINTEGTISRYNHETNDLEAVSEDFWVLFERQVRELRERKDIMLSGT